MRGSPSKKSPKSMAKQSDPYGGGSQSYGMAPGSQDVAPHLSNLGSNLQSHQDLKQNHKAEIKNAQASMLAKKEALQKSQIALANTKKGASSIDPTVKADYSMGARGGGDDMTEITKQQMISKNQYDSNAQQIDFGDNQLE